MTENFFSFPSIKELRERFETDEDFATAVGLSFDNAEMTADEFEQAIGRAYHETDDDVLSKLSEALDAPAEISGFTVPSTGLKALSVALWCDGVRLVRRFRKNSGGFFNLIVQNRSPACGWSSIAADMEWSSEGVMETTINQTAVRAFEATDPAGIPATGAYSIVVQPSNGTVTINADTGVVQYVPNEDFDGIDTLTVQCVNNDGASNQLSVSVTVSTV